MKYRDKTFTDKNGKVVPKIFIKDKTTVVYGEGKPNSQLADLIGKTIGDIYYQEPGLSYDEVIEGKGIAKCSSDDEYDAKKGIIIASRRAELNVLNKQRRNYYNILHKLVLLKNKLWFEILNITERTNNAQAELDEVLNKDEKEN